MLLTLVWSGVGYSYATKKFMVRNLELAKFLEHLYNTFFIYFLLHYTDLLASYTCCVQKNVVIADCLRSLLFRSLLNFVLYFGAIKFDF